jgi:hypothetical protein
MLIHGELNGFSRRDAGIIVWKSFAALADEGVLLLEPDALAAVRDVGSHAASWNSAEAG